MKAMALEKPRTLFVPVERPDPLPGAGELRLRVEACAVCRTDLRIVDGELEHPKLPLVPGHEIVGVVDALGVDGERLGRRVGVPWLGIPAAPAPTVAPARKISAIGRSSPAIRAMAASPATWLPMPALPSIWRRGRSRRACAAVRRLIGWRSLKRAGEG
jgi:propanol-preferring alcohol dehydrogenase